MRRFAIQYVDRLLAGKDYSQLAELCAIICGAQAFSQDGPDYNLPRPMFIFVEALGWFAQTIRSGAVTYYEATPQVRQGAMSSAMRSYAPKAYSDWYDRGMAEWSQQNKIRALHSWVTANDDKVHAWLRKLVVDHRYIVLELTA
jgi:hypothetical protein